MWEFLTGLALNSSLDESEQAARAKIKKVEFRAEDADVFGRLELVHTWWRETLWKREHRGREGSCH